MTIRRALILIVAVLVTACGGGSSSSSSPSTPTSPSSPAPTSTTVRYAALGASDANGVGSSAPCVPFTACENGAGYVPSLARLLRTGREVTLVNLGIPAAVLSPTIYELGRRYGREIPANFIERELPFVPGDSTLITVLGGPNDVNALGDAVSQGAAGNDLKGYLDAQIRAFGSDYDRLVQGLRSRAPNATVILINVPNMAGLPYSAGYPLQARQVLQYISVGFSREVNRQGGSRVLIADAMCDAQIYASSGFASDGFHPNDSGHSYLAQRLLSIVNTGVGGAASSCGQMTLVPAL
ncbi:MAG: SGNH/GDSL hydrolase family protein [Vicinamibacterales bacterium]